MRESDKDNNSSQHWEYVLLYDDCTSVSANNTSILQMVVMYDKVKKGYLCLVF